jgi:hypothetical protein
MGPLGRASVPGLAPRVPVRIAARPAWTSGGTGPMDAERSEAYSLDPTGSPALRHSAAIVCAAWAVYAACTDWQVARAVAPH